MESEQSGGRSTFIEFFVVLAVVGLLLMVAVAVIARARASSRAEECMNNMRQWGLGVHDFYTKRRVYPAASNVVKDYEGTIVDVGFHPNSRVGWSWLIYVLPQLEESSKKEFVRIRDAGPLNEPAALPGLHRKAMNQAFPLLRCPSFRGTAWRDPQAKTEAITNYKAMGATHLESLKVATTQSGQAQPGYGDADPAVHPDGAMFPGACLNESDFADGTSHTIFLCETVEQDAARWTVGMETVLVGLPPEITYQQYGGHWAPDGFDGQYDESSGVREAHPDWCTYVGYDYESRPYQDYTGGMLQAKYGPSSHHGGFVHHLFGDNRVERISTQVDPALYMFLITRSGHNPTLDDSE